MRRILPACLGLLILAGCQSVPEQDAIRPLRDNGPKLKYDELLLRARKQVDVLTEKTLTEKNWGDVQDGCTALEQTVKLLPFSPEAPEKEKREPMLRLAEAMGNDARKLKSAASDVAKLTGAEQTKKMKEVDEALLNLTKNIRILWKSE
jgi:hypothetical protein